jgi:uracil-DNA glycosylase
VHPSPLSAHGGFFTCGHFKKCNEWLASRYGADSQIDWSLSPKISVLESRPTAPSLIVKEQTTKKNSSELSAKTTKVDAIAKAQLEAQDEDAEAIAAMVAAEDDLDDLDDLEENADTVAEEEELVTTTEEK